MFRQLSISVFLQGLKGRTHFGIARTFHTKCLKNHICKLIITAEKCNMSQEDEMSKLTYQ